MTGDTIDMNRICCHSGCRSSFRKLFTCFFYSIVLVLAIAICSFQKKTVLTIQRGVYQPTRVESSSPEVSRTMLFEVNGVTQSVYRNLVEVAMTRTVQQKSNIRRGRPKLETQRTHYQMKLSG